MRLPYDLHEPKLELQTRQGRAATRASDDVFGGARGAKGAGGHAGLLYENCMVFVPVDARALNNFVDSFSG